MKNQNLLTGHYARQTKQTRDNDLDPDVETNVSLEYVEVTALRPHPDNPRAHSKKQIRQIAESIRAFGFRVPVVIDHSLADFETGNTLQLTGQATVDWDPARAAAFPGAHRVVDFQITQAAQLKAILPFRGTLTDYSPFNPA